MMDDLFLKMLHYVRTWNFAALIGVCLVMRPSGLLEYHVEIPICCNLCGEVLDAFDHSALVKKIEG